MSHTPFRFGLLASTLAFSCFLGAAASAQDGYTGANAYSAAATAMETRLSAVEDQMRALTGKVEQIDYALRRIDQSLQRLQGDYDARLNKLETAPPPAAHAAPSASAPASSAATPPAAGTETTASEEGAETPAVTGSLGGVKVRGDKVTGAIVNPKAPPLPDKPADYGLTAQEHYSHAFGLLQQANYEEAEKAFKSFIEKHGQDKLIDNAKYWYAETFYVRGKFGDAAVAFAEAFEQNAKGTKAPDSLLKLAMSLAKVDKVQDACSTLAALKAKYPTASATLRVRADQERSRLKCK